MSEPIHIKPTAELAPRVLMPGDPGRALLFAQTLLSSPAMFNHHRGLWAYTGLAADGEPLTIQSTGMGGPSAAIVMAELADLGATRFLRAGTCGALAGRLRLGDLVIVTEAVAGDGTSRALGAPERVSPDPVLLGALLALEEPDVSAGVVASTDLFYAAGPELERAWRQAGAAAVDMESAALLSLAQQRGLQAGSILLVSDLLRSQRVRMAMPELRAGEQRLGELAARALTGAGRV